MMPMDPFFTSAYKKHYLPNEAHAELMARVRAMSRDEREKWEQSIWSKLPRERTNAEWSVIKSLRFERGIAGSAKNRYHGERIASDLAKAAQMTHTVVLHGQSGVGNHRGAIQNRATKQNINRQGAPRHFIRAYDKKKR